MAASSIGMHWTPLFPSHTSWKWCIQVSGCIEPISTPPSPENMHPSSTQCQHCRKPTPTSLRHQYDWWKYFPIWALLLLSLTIKLNVSTITVFMRQVLTPTTTTIPLNAYQQIGHCPHFMCIQSAYRDIVCISMSDQPLLSSPFTEVEEKKSILTLADHCFSFSPRLLN